MNTTVLTTGKWLSILLAVISSFWLLFGQLYVIQFILLAYAFDLQEQKGSISRPKIPSWLIITITVLSSAVTIWMGYRTEMGFKNGINHYGAPSMTTIVLSLLDVVLMVVTLILYANVLKKAK